MISQRDERVEVPGRLVRDDHAGLVDEGPGDRRPLLLAAGERDRELVGLGAQPHHGQGALDRRADPSARRPGHLQRERDVLADRAGREAA